MSLAYKLLNPGRTTYGGCQWTVGEWKDTSGEGPLCGLGWLHAYEHAEIAHFLNPIHAKFESPVLWIVEVDGAHKRDGQQKSGWTRMWLLEPHPLPVPTTEQRVRFAIACSLSVYHDQSHRAWAERWINGTDRSNNTAVWAGAAAWAAAGAAEVVGSAQAWAAEAAAWAAESAESAQAWAAAWATAWAAARAASWAAEAAELAGARAAVWAAARAAAWAAEAAAEATEPCSLVACAQWALSDSTTLLTLPLE